MSSSFRLYSIMRGFFIVCLALSSFLYSLQIQAQQIDGGSPVLSSSTEDSTVDLLKKIESDPSVQPPETSSSTMVEAINESSLIVPPPSNQNLAPPDAVAPMPGSGGIAAGAEIRTIDVPPVPALPPGAAADENLFFDSEALTPGEMREAMPQKVNPAVTPASKFVVITKNKDADSLQARLVSAQRAVSLGRYDSALRIYDDLSQEHGRNPNVLLGRAVALQRVGRNDESISAYEALLQIQPNNIEAQTNMLGLMGQSYPAVALQRLNALREKNQDEAGIMAQIAVVQARLGHYQEAMEALGVAAGLDANNASHLYNMAVVSDRAGQTKNAIQYYEKALELDTIYGGSRSIPREAVFGRLAQLR